MQTLHNPPVVQAWQTAVQKETRTRPWLTSFLLRQSPHLFTRFANYYQQLLAAPRKVRRQLGAGLATAALLLALSSSPAHAATITVGGGCNLVQAIQSANTDASVGSCTAGSGADTIVLAGNTYSYSTAYGTGSALPDITSPIIIEANGATIERISGTMRIITVVINGNLTLNDATITGGNPVGGGGGIYNSNGTIILNNSTVSGNTATYYTGGGIYNNHGTLTLNNSTVSGNTATYGGGGIFNRFGGTTTLNNSTVSGNLGGGIFNDGMATLNNSTVSGNTAGYGGGISNRRTATLNNSTVSGNTAQSRGGGIYNNEEGIIVLNNNTISGNIAINAGGGIFNDSGATTTLARTIVSGNTSPVGAEVRGFAGTITAANHNVFGHSGLTNAQAFSNFTPGATDITATSDGTTPTTLASILNTTLADNGGPTLTHALVTGSPAIDIIPVDGSVCILDTSTDQRGAVRGSGANRGGAACDAGAYEFASAETPTAVTNLLTQTTSQPPTTILALLATLLAAFSGVRLWRRW